MCEHKWKLSRVSEADVYCSVCQEDMSIEEIERRLNAHDALLAALREFICPVHREQADAFFCTQDSLNFFCVTARAAIAAAEGTK